MTAFFFLLSSSSSFFFISRNLAAELAQLRAHEEKVSKKEKKQLEALAKEKEYVILVLSLVLISHFLENWSTKSRS